MERDALRRLRIAAAVVALAVAAAVATLTALDARPVAAQAPDIDAQALQLERQLLCPECTNKRLDVCELPICRDMKSLIRERLEAGALPEDILLYFSGRYGQRVLAELAKEGFNLWLWGWVAGSLLLIPVAGAWWLVGQRRTTRHAAAEALDAADERWLDEQTARGDGG